ncbi:MAG: hypothetical protein ACJ0QP_05290 [Schleiferiaceae bacterium]
MRSVLRVNKYHISNSSRGVRRFYDNLVFELTKLIGIDMLVEVEKKSLVYTGLRKILEPVHKLPIFAFNTNVIVHDMISFRHKYNGLVWAILWCFYFIAFNLAHRIFVFSVFEKNYIKKTFRLKTVDKIKIFTPVYNDVILALETKLIDSLNVGEKFLIVTNNISHKNAGMIKDLQVENIPLVVIGIEGNNTDNVKYFQEVSDLDYWSAIRYCKNLICLSEDEGFNLPVYDTIRSGKSPIIRDIPVHRELYEGYALFYNTLSELFSALKESSYANKLEFKHKYKGWSELV